MINFRIRIKQIRKALFISRSVRPEYTVYDIKLSSLHKAMTDYYAPSDYITSFTGNNGSYSYTDYGNKNFALY